MIICLPGWCSYAHHARIINYNQSDDYNSNNIRKTNENLTVDHDTSQHATNTLIRTHTINIISNNTNNKRIWCYFIIISSLYIIIHNNTKISIRTFKRRSMVS